VVVKGSQGTEGRDIQCARGDGRREDILSRGVQAYALPHSGVGLLRIDQDTPNGKQPWYFTARDGSPALTTAGLWDEWRDRGSGETLKSHTMIITEPNEFVAEVHDPHACSTCRKGF
jgi:hypothetical protein